MQEYNLYDEEHFFNEYMKIRNSKNSANELEEQPALRALIGDVRQKTILDLGCGSGLTCRYLSESGALRVLGIDKSRRMLDVAQRENSAPNIEYRELSMENLYELPGGFDLAVSSLAVHYVEDIAALFSQVYQKLSCGGRWIFSQEHPLTTAPEGETVWATGAGGGIEHYMLTDYNRPGIRRVEWLKSTVIKYHRTFSEIVNALIKAGFVIEAVLEPVPLNTEETPRSSKEKALHKPNFLLIKSKKTL